MVLKNISPGCGVRASLMLFFQLCLLTLNLPTGPSSTVSPAGKLMKMYGPWAVITEIL